MPIWVVVAAAIVVEDGRPIFFSRKVSGQKGRSFRLYKFRTMKHGNHSAVDLPISRDPRLTRVGKFLRPTGLDELPALWHILWGEMSFVGPRTLLPRVEDPSDPDRGKEAFTLPRAALRNQIRPGLTGFAQIYAPKNYSYRRKFRYDALYVQKMSACLDFKLVALSFLRTFSRRWE
ncbi:sugar transferase [Acidobacteria bacterium AH-259-L09]|nr:sugar transferase [Acidobacteria bacterium AH-259-L09]